MQTEVPSNAVSAKKMKKERKMKSDSILGYTLKSYFRMHFNIILLSMPRSSILSGSLVTTAWHVIRMHMEGAVIRYGW